MIDMRTTLAIADDIRRELKELARRADRSMPVDMGEPRVHLTKALALAIAIEDEGHLRKL